MLAKDDKIYQVLVLTAAIFTTSCESKIYKVRDSNEDGPSEIPNDSGSPSTFIFPDYFRKSEDEGFLGGRLEYNQFRRKPNGLPFGKLYDNWDAPVTKTKETHFPPRESYNDLKKKTNHRPSHLTPGPPYEKLPFHSYSPKFKGNYKSVKPFKSTSFAPVDSQENAGRVHQHYFGVKHNYKPQKKDEIDYIIAPKQKYHYRKEKRSNKYVAFPKGSWDAYQNYRNKYPKSSQGVLKFRPSSKHNKAESRKDDECVKKTFGVSALMSCFTCVDGNGQEYEQCALDNTKKSKKRLRRSIVRKRRNYYDEDKANIFGPDYSEYRFGPEDFENGDLSPVDSGNGEKCNKRKKGNMQCIVCENERNGRTYEQCSYGSEPKKNSYERSISKVYDSRSPENRSIKQVIKKPKQTQLAPVPSSYSQVPEFTKTETLDPYNPEYINYFHTSKNPYNYHKVFPETSFSEYDYDYPDGQGHHSSDTHSVTIPNRTCKKIKKNGMTCYHCIDASGSTHQDCINIVDKNPSIQESKSLINYPSESTEYHEIIPKSELFKA